MAGMDEGKEKIVMLLSFNAVVLWPVLHRGDVMVTVRLKTQRHVTYHWGR